MIGVVSNASPLINLARIGMLHLLPTLFTEIAIPQAVHDEIVIQGSGQPGAEDVGAADWVRVQTVANRPLVRALRQELDPGEAEAIALALESGAELLLMDERLGREVAQQLGLRCLGLVGILISAKRQGLIERVAPPLQILVHGGGFRLSEELHRRVLGDEGEL